MIIAALAAWSGTLLVLAGAIVAAVLATRRHQPVLALVALLPVVAGVVSLAAGISIPPPHPTLWVAAAFGLAALGVIGGSPLTVLVLDLATPDRAEAGRHGGILVREKGARTAKEVLRGGAAIGYLERVAVIGAIALGHLEVVAAVIAIKGLGRFSELDSAEARERFIIGTLASMIWASACGVLIAW